MKIRPYEQMYILKPESVLESKMHKVLCHLEIPIDYQISTRQPDLMTVNKKEENQPNSGLCRVKPIDYQISARQPDLVTVNKKEENQPNSGLCRVKPIDYQISARQPDLVTVTKKKRTTRTMGFAEWNQ